jgi:NAD(P)-dependent dehydrogenase (short-subunit alcohol dehydrogenase family)
MTKTALVTGAGSGIGRHSALALSKAGYAVFICGRREESLQATVAMAGSDGESITPIICDVAEPQGVAKMFTEIEGAHGRLDVLFNNAGANTPSTNFGDLTFEQWKHVIDVNLSGVFLCARHAFELMRRQDPQGGRIINNGSISAHAPRPGSAPYTASKHAVTGLTKTISLDGRVFNIACGQIDVGNALTPLTERMQKGVPQADGSIKPEDTMDVEDVANAIVSMAALPLSANIQFMTIMATNIPFIGRG